jgi:hypothetical protein
MRPWMQESRLAPHILAQRSVTRARTPVTPTGFASPNASQHGHRPEDLARLDRVTAALHDIRARLAHNTNTDLSHRVVQLLAFLQQLREDFPLQAPEEAFERLQQLRSWLFWLPPAMLRPTDASGAGSISEQGAFAVLAHFFAVALALDPLFPEIGGTYLGSMSVQPVEEMRRILLARGPQDSVAQLALALMETPIQMCGDYKARQQYLASQQQQQQQQQADSWRNSGPGSHGSSPRRDFAGPTLASTPELPPANLFSPNSNNHSPMQSPGSLHVPGSPYFGTQQHSRSRSHFTQLQQLPSRSPGSMRPQLLPEQRSHSYHSPLSGGGSYGDIKHEHEFSGWRPEAAGQTAFHPYGGGGVIGTGFVAPAQLWT